MAVPALNQSIKSNPGNASAWHLLALMLFLRDDIEQAKKICDLGIKECGRDLKATDVFTKKVDFILYVPFFLSHFIIPDFLQA